MKSRFFFLTVMVCLAAWVAQAAGTSIKTSAPFNKKDHEYALEKGTESLSGRGTLRLSSGSVLTCEAAGARLFPVTPYTVERMTATYGSPVDGFRAAYDAISFSNEPRAYRRYNRITTCDSSGSFTFDGLVPGDYFVIVGLLGDSQADRFSYGYLMKRVTVQSGIAISVELSR